MAVVVLSDDDDDKDDEDDDNDDDVDDSRNRIDIFLLNRMEYTIGSCMQAREEKKTTRLSRKLHGKPGLDADSAG